MTEQWQIVCGTGHRTLSERADESWTREKMARCAQWLRKEHGTIAVVSGMARGFDLWWADTIAQTDGLELWAYIPFNGHTDPWTKAEQREAERLCGLADNVRIVNPQPLPAGLTGRQRSAIVNQRLYARNIEMLYVSDAVVAVWEPGRLDGGTVSALLEAAKRGMPGVHLDPIGQHVHGLLPPADQLERRALYHRRCGHVAQVASAAEIEQRRAHLHAAGRDDWQTRRARPREQRGTGCRTCRPAATQNGVAA